MSTETNEALQTSDTALERPAAAAIQPAGSESKLAQACGHVSNDMMLEQWSISGYLGDVYEDGLLDGGWTPEDTQGLKKAGLAFAKAVSQFMLKRMESRSLTTSFRAVLAESVVVRDRLVRALAVVTDGAKSESSNPARLHLTGTRKSAGLLCVWFNEMLSELTPHVPALTKLLKQDPLELAESQRDTLRGALAHHQLDLMRAPTLAKELHAARARLAASIARQQRAAQFAFQGDKAMLKLFVPVWSKKFRRRAKKRAPSPVAETPQLDAGAQAALPEAPVASEERELQHATLSRE